MTQTIAEKVTASVSASFILAAGMFCAGCGGPAKEYVQSKVSAPVPIPKEIRKTRVAASTYEYWSRAKAAIDACSDTKSAVDSKVPGYGYAYIGKDSIQALRALPTKGVDPDAVKNIHTVADNFEYMQGVQKQLNEKAAVMGVSLAQGVSGDIDGLAHATTSDDFADAAVKTATDAVTKLDVKSASGIIKTLEAMGNEDKKMDSELREVSRKYSVKYHTPFPTISILNFNADSGFCELPPPAL